MMSQTVIFLNIKSHSLEGVSDQDPENIWIKEERNAEGWRKLRNEDDQIKEYEIDRAYNTHGQDTCRKLWREILKQRTILKT